MTRFNAQHGLIVVRATFFGPTGKQRVTRLALDTGATSTLVNIQVLKAIGYDPDIVPKTVQLTTGSGAEAVARLDIDRIEALGQERHHFSVIAHTLPSSASIDGLLGLDFFRNHTLTIDFRQGEIVLV